MPATCVQQLKRGRLPCTLAYVSSTWGAENGDGGHLLRTRSVMVPSHARRRPAGASDVDVDVDVDRTATWWPTKICACRSTEIRGKATSAARVDAGRSRYRRAGVCRLHRLLRFAGPNVVQWERLRAACPFIHGAECQNLPVFWHLLYDFTPRT